MSGRAEAAKAAEPSGSREHSVSKLMDVSNDGRGRAALARRMGCGAGGGERDRLEAHRIAAEGVVLVVEGCVRRRLHAIRACLLRGRACGGRTICLFEHYTVVSQNRRRFKSVHPAPWRSRRKRSLRALRRVKRRRVGSVQKVDERR